MVWGQSSRVYTHKIKQKTVADGPVANDGEKKASPEEKAEANVKEQQETKEKQIAGYAAREGNCNKMYLMDDDPDEAADAAEQSEKGRGGTAGE